MIEKETIITKPEVENKNRIIKFSLEEFGLLLFSESKIEIFNKNLAGLLGNKPKILVNNITFHNPMLFNMRT